MAKTLFVSEKDSRALQNMLFTNILSKSPLLQVIPDYDNNPTTVDKISWYRRTKFRPVQQRRLDNNYNKVDSPDYQMKEGTAKTYGDAFEIDVLKVKRNGIDIVQNELNTISQSIGFGINFDIVNGDSVATAGLEFDGMKAMTEFNGQITTSAAAVTNQTTADAVLKDFKGARRQLGEAQFIFTGSTGEDIAQSLQTYIQSVSTRMDNVGIPVTTVNGIPLRHAGYDYLGDEVIDTYTLNSITYVDFYFLNLGLDGLAKKFKRPEAEPTKERKIITWDMETLFLLIDKSTRAVHRVRVPVS